MKKILVLIGLVISGMAYGQNGKQQTFYLSGDDNVLDNEYVRVSEIDIAPESVLSGDIGNLKKIPLIDADTLYPRIVTAASDTTGRSAEKAGDIFIDSAANKIYISTGAGRGKFMILNIFLLVFMIGKKRK